MSVKLKVRDRYGRRSFHCIEAPEEVRWEDLRATLKARVCVLMVFAGLIWGAIILVAMVATLVHS